MPWEPKDATRHTHKAKTAKKKRQWSDVADSALERGESEGSAIRMANAVVAGTAHHRGRRREGSRLETRQEGGPVDAGKKYLVGEQGAEQFKPKPGAAARLEDKRVQRGEAGPLATGRAAIRGAATGDSERMIGPGNWTMKKEMVETLTPLDKKVDVIRGMKRSTEMAPVEGRQSGGPVEEGQPYMVGEKGPEIFKPAEDGKIIPHHKLKKRRMGAKSGMRAPLGRNGEELRKTG